MKIKINSCASMEAALIKVNLCLNRSLGTELNLCINEIYNDENNCLRQWNSDL